MDCKQANILLAHHILGDLDNDPWCCKELQAHLLCCLDCAEIYDDFRMTIGFVLGHKTEFAQAFEKARTKEYEENKLIRQYGLVSDKSVVLVEKLGQSYRPKITAPKDPACHSRCCPTFAESTEKSKKFQLSLYVGTVAACLLIAMFIWMVFSNYPEPQTFSQGISFKQTASAHRLSMKVEFVSNTGIISSDQQITPARQLKTLLINGKYQMVMNVGTTLIAEPLLYSQLGVL